MTTQAATRTDIDDILGVLDQMMTRIDYRFIAGENSLSKLQSAVNNIQNQLADLKIIDKKGTFAEIVKAV